MLRVGIEIFSRPFKALGGPQELPPRGLVAGAPETLRIHEGFHRQHRVAKALPPILRQSRGDQLQNPRG